MFKLLSKFLFLYLYSVNTFASELAFSRNARTFETQHESLIVKSLSFACLTLKQVSDGLPCNPAMTPKTQNGTLKLEGLISNGYSNFSKVSKLMDGDVDQDFVNSLFADEQVLQMESNLDLFFLSKYLNARFTPSSFKFFSVVRNDANPDLELFAVNEQSLTIQSGFSYYDFDFGIEFQSMSWKFIKQRMKLLALSTPAGAEAIKPKQQIGTFLQPAATYNIPYYWSPRIALKIVNLGSVDQEYEEFKHPVEPQLGLGISPPVPYGTLELLLDYKSLSYEESQSERFHLGALYSYGVMYIGAGIDSNGISAGVYYALEQVNAGILFSTTKLPFREEEYFAQTVYIQFGWQL